MNEISCLELKELLKTKSISLIDVREKEEVDICSINGAIHIPMNSLPLELPKLKINTKYAIICHSGVRSYHACNYLLKLGFSVVNVIGGIDKWALTCDLKMKRY